ncbi:MAG TPA: hypothetical protein VFT82_01580 [Candidatus Paceibacterota bacterium]|nr:hypothetical protein [Candidatus Paceibacterota bacterium]
MNHIVHTVLGLPLVPAAGPLSALVSAAKLNYVSELPDPSCFAPDDEIPKSVLLVSFGELVLPEEIFDFFARSGIRLPSLETFFRLAAQYPGIEKERPCLCLPKDKGCAGRAGGVSLNGYRHNRYRFVDRMPLMGYCGHYYSLGV